MDCIIHSHAFADCARECMFRWTGRDSVRRCVLRAHASQRSPQREFPDSRCKSFREREKETFGSERARQPPDMIFTELGLALRVGASFDASSLETIIGGQTVRIDKAGTVVEVWCVAMRCMLDDGGVCLLRSGIVIAGGWMHRLIRSDGKESRHT